MESVVEKGEIGKRDLQLLLRPKLGKQVSVERCAISSLLPPGENFACTILKVDATIRRDEDEPEEDLHLVAKVFPTAEAMRQVFDFTALFKKEIFFYERLEPVYKQLQTEFGVQEPEMFDIVPEFYGGRMSRDPDSENYDDGAMILMKNVKHDGFYTLDKVEGADPSFPI